MTVLLGALVGVCFGQVVGISETIPPDDQLPIKFMMQDGSSFVGVPASENWESARNINVRLDQPWAGSPNERVDVGAVDRANSLRERPSEWRQRHERNWTERGYVDLDDSDAYYWVPKSELALAQRARDMAAVEPEIVGAAPAGATGAERASNVTPAERVGFFALWGTHIAVVAGALALMAAAVWFFRFRD